MAWHPLGWTPAFFSEIEKFPSAVLASHYGSNLPGEAPAANGVPNLGDMTKFQEWPDYAIELLVGGTPCQSFSVAGLRAGLADPRGNLMLTYLAIAARYQPRWLVWENVPGVLSSNGGRDFGTFLAGLGELGYGFAYRVLDAQFCRAHGHEWAVPQRRRRVFVVGYLGDWRRAAAVLFDTAGLRGDSAPRREAGQRVAPTISARTKGGGGRGTDFDCDGGLIAQAFGGNDTRGPIEASTALNAHGGPAGRLDFESETFVVAPQPIVLVERGRGDGPNLETRQDGTANAILTPNGGRGGLGVGAVAYGLATSVTPKFGVEVSPTLTIPSPTGGGQPAAVAHAIQAGALRQNPASGPDGIGVQADIAYTLEARPEVQAVQAAWAVRRLTPRECERLQGFPDDFTAILHRGKPAADGPRYKALGNSMAVNVMRVIGERIAMVEAA